jgi:thiol:disulfide interchange protein/DsbC/DsbD-like thiol-disulfide interchange protein
MVRRQYHSFLGVAMLALGLLALPCRSDAAESPPVRTARTTASLVSDTDRIAPDKPFRVGLRLKMAPGWHTYWKNPGDAGAAPELNLTLPAGAKAGPIAWPAPDRLMEGPIATYAYAGELLLPVQVTPGSEGGPMTLRADANWLVCKEICVPEEAKFELVLPAGTPSPSPQAPLLDTADIRIPRDAGWQATIARDGTLHVTGGEIAPATVAEAWFMPASAGGIDHGAAQKLTVGTGELYLALTPGREFKPDAGLDGVLSILDNSHQRNNVALHAEPGGAAPVLPQEPPMPLLRMLGFAFLGGLILNLMPCVFPVLAMKAVSLAGGAVRGEVRAHSLSYTAGVLLAFATLGSVLLAARAAGAAAGWGFQFQSPAFVAGMAWLLFAIGLNLSGVFHIGIGLTGAGQGLAMRGGHAGSFFTGLLAVLVATPCTAPFMGAAIAGALAAPPSVTILVFLAMGVGLAAPYLLLAAWPSLARAAPRPGRWMEIFRQVLAFPMYAASVWLVWVIAQEAGPQGVLATASGILLVAFAAWGLGLSQSLQALQPRRFARAAAVAALLAAGAVLGGIAIAPSSAAPLAETGAESFTAERLAALRAEGKPVFVNMTAAWCVTCLLNERVALRSSAVQDAFTAKGITYLKGDWTRQDPAITAFLRSHGRDGVPLYVFFPADNGPPKLLPQILTEGIVLNSLG